MEMQLDFLITKIYFWKSWANITYTRKIATESSADGLVYSH